MRLSDWQRLNRPPSPTATKRAAQKERMAAVDRELARQRTRLGAIIDGALKTARDENPALTAEECAEWRARILEDAMPTRRACAEIVRLRALGAD